MKRLYESVFEEHLAQHRQMIFIMGPRQSGKTTVAQTLIRTHKKGYYFSWDNIADRANILAGPQVIQKISQLAELSTIQPYIVFDEIHKYPLWRDFLKGFYDSYPNETRILVTGSAKLDAFNRGGDSLMGRYFPFHFHPLSVAELVQAGANISSEYWPTPLALPEDQFEALWRYGGYPDPFLKQNDRYALRWNNLRQQQLLNEEIRDLTRVQDIDRLELLIEQLKRQVGSLCSYQSFAKHLRVSDNTVRNWLSILKALYFCFEIKPWSQQVARSLLKEPKYYLWDWSRCHDESARAENFIAQHLLKAVHFWNDLGLGNYRLHFLRDKEKREVDFLVVKNNTPWMLVETKLSPTSEISPSLRYFYNQLNPEFAYQVVIKMPFVDKNCFESREMTIVPARTFLSQLT